jgi:ADP-ribose pyrophosphatase YjhB (NUDIX family)
VALPERHAAKLLILDAEQRIFLLCAEPPGERRYWLPPGGGVEPGETAEAAARREMLEETGWELELGPPVWTRRFVFTALDGIRKRQTETFFLVRAGEAPPWQPTHDLSVEAITTARWWPIGELVSESLELIYPEGLGEQLQRLLQTGSPTL